jgi:hypothetical protein
MPTCDFRLHGLLRIRINHDGGPFLGPLLARYGHYATPVAGEPDLVFDIGRFAPDRRAAWRLDGKYYVKEDSVGCDHRHKIARWTVEVKGLEGGPLAVRIDANLPGRVVMGGDTVPALIRYALARKGHSLVHGSAVERDGRALVFAGRSGAGKTITAARFVKAGWRFLGDDSCILGPSGVLGFVQPFNIRFTYDVKGLYGNPFTARDRLAIVSKRLLSIATAGRIGLLTSLPPERLLGAGIGEGGACSRYVILQGGDRFEVEDRYSAEAAVAQTLSNLSFECRELDAYLLAYAHVFPRSPAAAFWRRQAEILAGALKEARILRVTVPKDFTEPDFRRLAEALEAG